MMTLTARRQTRKPAAASVRIQSDDPASSTIWHLGRAYYAYVGVLEELLAEFDLAHLIVPGMGHVLVALFEKDQCSIKTIAARANLSCSALTRLLGRMEQTGLIERNRDDRDSRVIRVTLTALGRSIKPRFYEVVQAMNDLFVAGLGARGADQIMRLLHRLTGTLRLEEERRRANRKEIARAAS
jgi:DNA-binding MarR family transcriptional regulator